MEVGGRGSSVVFQGRYETMWILCSYVQVTILEVSLLDFSTEGGS